MWLNLEISPFFKKKEKTFLKKNVDHFKVFIEFVTLLLLFYVLILGPGGL